ncbi:methionyl-tRNA formyltransferase [Akkermansiaceae bacterium]|nr:methionyl-tRNA formyltransferase [Akkermansiaceae bacterium]MDB4568296.1 methionyl-tRNA formyltransferase [Akkermansiaceae bacterium]
MRIVFMATGEIAEPVFTAALTSDHKILGLVTQPDRKVGRKQVLTAPGVKVLALEADVPVIQPEKVREKDALAQIREWKPDLIVVMAYGQILPQSLIEIPGKAIINLHASLLPKYRGASCVQGPIREGDAATGWSVIHVVKKLDAGNIILQHELKIASGETGGELHRRLAASAPAALLEALALLDKGEAPGIPQDDTAHTYVPKLLRDDGRLDWSESAGQLECTIRAFHPWPGTFCEMGGKRLKIFPPVKVGSGKGSPGAYLGELEGRIEIACGEGSLFLSLVQPDGKARMDAGSLVRGYRDLLANGLK